ncbi:MAG: hypothetical protein U0231_13745 [Nitrospiraceae bacterium]
MVGRAAAALVSSFHAGRGGRKDGAGTAADVEIVIWSCTLATDPTAAAVSRNRRALASALDTEPFTVSVWPSA